MKFSYKGSMSASKSLFNRALIVQSYNQDIDLIGKSESQDVTNMRVALQALHDGQELLDCGEAGTTLRFLMARASRLPGKRVLKGSSRLFSRPHAGLIKVLKEFGVEATMAGDHCQIKSTGWKEPERSVVVDCSHSSQFISAILLNAWSLPFDLTLELSEQKASEAYLVMTLMVVQNFGMEVHSTGSNKLVIPRHQKPKTKNYPIEPDFSSCFCLAACAVFGGDLTIDPFPEQSVQPDRIFVPVLQGMGVRIFYNNMKLTVQQTEKLKPIEVDLNNSPDMFPILCVLLARANGDSLVTGISQLPYKESNRLENTKKLLKLLGRAFKHEGDKFTIYGNVRPFEAISDFDPDQDHRMAMAAQVANYGGAQLNILNKQVVNKSFPEFWNIVKG